jgi:alginate O-acetyltransferase complex protein AlgI
VIWKREPRFPDHDPPYAPIMLFNSYKFLFLFLPIAYCVYWSLKTRESRYVWLTITGYVFYSYWNYKFCALMAFSTLVSYAAGVGLLTWTDPVRRRLCLVLPITIDLLLLGFFKYTNFLLGSADQLAVSLGIALHAPTLDIVLPVGISFYTFHTITYIVDGYRGVIKPTRNFFEFACYVSFFAQLVAGPIVRFRQIEGDLDRIDIADRRATLNIGWSFFALGMIKKVLLADTIAAMINPILDKPNGLPTLTAWLSMIGYTYQIYFDFSGYSDMAVGLGYLFGLRLPQNFNSPYKALDIADFWHRWHISLSSCLRDYLFIPLGGSRGSRLQTYRNLLITMFLGGLWHGANWTFVVWGLYHGLLLALHRATREFTDRLPRTVRWSATFLAVVIGWVFFRSDNFGMAAALLHSMFMWTQGPSFPWEPTVLAVLAVSAVVVHGLPNTFEISHAWHPTLALCLAALFTVCLFLIYGAQSSPFLYFQF